MKRRPLAFLGKLSKKDWKRAMILAEILAPPLALRPLGGRSWAALPRD